MLLLHNFYFPSPLSWFFVCWIPRQARTKKLYVLLKCFFDPKTSTKKELTLVCSNHLTSYLFINGKF